MLEAFHNFVLRYKAEETLMFWLAVEVFRHRQWKPTKFFGMESELNMVSSSEVGPVPSKRDMGDKRKSKKVIDKEAKKKQALTKLAAERQRHIDIKAAHHMGVSLEQLYLVKEADFIYDYFVKQDGPQWTCLDASVERQIDMRLRFPRELTRDCFKEAQDQAFRGMNEDLIPRFIQELTAESLRNPVRPELKEACERLQELKMAPPRRKTGVSTALAFAFRRQTSEEKVKTSSREKGQLEAKDLDTTRLDNVLRQRSNLQMLGSDSQAIHALGLTRARLSTGANSDLFDLDVKRGGVRPSSLRISVRSFNRSSLGKKYELGLQRTKSDACILSGDALTRGQELGLTIDRFHARDSMKKVKRGRASTI